MGHYFTQSMYVLLVLDEYILLLWWMEMQEPAISLSSYERFIISWSLKKILLFYLWELWIHFKVRLDLGAIESKNKHPWVDTAASLEFNPWQNSDQHSLGEERGKKTLSLLLPLMSALHFKGKASPTCHTLVNSLILTWFEVQHPLLCRRTAKCPVAGW